VPWVPSAKLTRDPGVGDEVEEKRRRNSEIKPGHLKAIDLQHVKTVIHPKSNSPLPA